MRIVKWGVFAIAFTVLPVWSSAQTPGAASGDVSMVEDTDVRKAVARAATELKPGVNISDHLVSLSDLGKYAVGVAVVARPAGTFTGSLSHDAITEVYYILKGSGTNVTGKMVDGTRGARTSPVVGPSLSSNSPLQNATTQKLGPGDILVIPPGVGHAFTSVDPGGIEYLVFRVDPEKVLKSEGQ